MNKFLVICMALGGFAIDWLAFYPGFLYIDSVDQYRQAVSFQYGDWHPPVMAALWSVLNLVHRGPQLMLFLQLLLLWSSFYILATTWCRRPFVFGALLLLFACAPYVQNFAGLIVKDTHMALCWLLVIVMLLRARYYDRKLTRPEAVLTFLLLAYGTMVRINALPGCLPLFFLWVDGVFTVALRRKVSIVGVSVVAVIVTQGFLEKVVLKTHKQYPGYKLMAHDLVGIYARTGRNHFPAFIRNHPGFDADYLGNHYLTATMDNIWWYPKRDTLLPKLTDETRSELIQCWRQALQENPGAYLANHYDGILYFLRIKVRKGAEFYYYYPYVYPNEFGFKFQPNAISKVVLGTIRMNSRWPYMQPWFWLLAPVIILVVTLRRRADAIKWFVVCLCLSSILYLLPQFFIYQADTEFRYFYWNCIAASLSVVLLLGRVGNGAKKDLHTKRRS